MDDHPGLQKYMAGARIVVALLAVVAVTSWFYVARNDDWRGWIFAVPSTVSLLGIMVLAAATRQNAEGSKSVDD